MKDLARRKEKLRVKEDELRKYRLRFQDSILDKEEKCVKSARKAEKERNVLNQKEKELIVLREEHGKMKQKRAQIQAQMQKYSKFYQFLQKVVDMSAEVPYAPTEHTHSNSFFPLPSHRCQPIHEDSVS
ncbi:Hypothetical predicted protein [Pelobates cultripes]|uniref:DUF4200 domain-containing protein n=1 Tax=Pelobates cultripes TaxID=61616 RepID=A0AAD1SRN0_PELCU|nr:Hypothetical predicted protein [Pelobates cultripes]